MCHTLYRERKEKRGSTDQGIQYRCTDKSAEQRAYEAELGSGNIGPDDLVYIAFDVNGLKYVNDNLGHAAGDEFAAMIHMSADGLEKTGKEFRRANRG